MRLMQRLLQGAVLFTLSLGAIPVPAHESVKEDVLICRATDVITTGTGLQNRTFSILSLANLNEAGDQAVRRVIVYGYDGQVLCDFPGLNLYPASFKATLGPHEMSSLNMNNLGCLMPTPVNQGGTLLVYISWSSLDRTAKIPLEAVTVQTVVDPANNRVLARDHFVCTTNKD
jgi:hypothetical protein